MTRRSVMALTTFAVLGLPLLAPVPADASERLHDVVELRVGVLGATPVTIVYRGAVEGPTGDEPELWTEVEALPYPIGVAVGILDRDDQVLGIRLFRPDEDDGDTVIGDVLIEPGVDGEADLDGELTFVVRLVEARREPIDAEAVEPGDPDEP